MGNDDDNEDDASVRLYHFRHFYRQIRFVRIGGSVNFRIRLDFRCAVARNNNIIVVERSYFDGGAARRRPCFAYGRANETADRGIEAYRRYHRMVDRKR